MVHFNKYSGIVVVQDGKEYSIGHLVNMATARGVTLSESTIRARVKRGLIDVDSILAPSRPHSRKDKGRLEVQAAIARLGPPKRY